MHEWLFNYAMPKWRLHWKLVLLEYSRQINTNLTIIREKVKVQIIIKHGDLF